MDEQPKLFDQPGSQVRRIGQNRVDIAADPRVLIAHLIVSGAIPQVGFVTATQTSTH
jgi:hypothetical protein